MTILSYLLCGKSLAKEPVIARGFGGPQEFLKEPCLN